MLCLLFRISAEVDLLQVCATLNEWRKTKPPIGTCQAVMRLEARSQEKIWWSWRGLNPRPSDCQSDALPTALQPQPPGILSSGFRESQGKHRTLKVCCQDARWHLDLICLGDP